MHTWQTELLKELRNQPETIDRNNLITNLEQHGGDPGATAAELRRIGLEYFANLVDQEFYHLRAKDQNRADGIELGDTHILKEDKVDQTTGHVATSAANTNAVPKSEVNTATTDDNEGDV